MPYYTQEQIEHAREMDLLTYLKEHDPGELVLEYLVKVRQIPFMDATAMMLDAESKCSRYSDACKYHM